MPSEVMQQKQPLIMIPEGYQLLRGVPNRVVHVQPKTDMMWIRDNPEDEDGLIALGVKFLGPSELVFMPQGLPHTQTTFFMRTSHDILAQKEDGLNQLLRMRFDRNCH